MLKRRRGNTHLAFWNQSSPRGPVILLGAAFLFYAVYWCDRQIRPTMLRTLQNECRQFAFSTFNDIADKSIEQMPEYYRQLYSFQYDPEGKIAAVIVDAHAVNRIQSHLSSEVEKRLQLIASNPLEIPIGTLSGIHVFIGRGPSLKLHLSPKAYVDTEIYSNVESAGINQTRLSLYARFVMNLSVAIAGYSTTIQVTNDEYLGEVLILGTIPQSYRTDMSG